MSPGIPKVHNQANPMLKNSKNVVIPTIDKMMLVQRENLDVLCIITQRAEMIITRKEWATHVFANAWQQFFVDDFAIVHIGQKCP